MDVITIILVVISGLVGLLMVFMAWSSRREARASREWPTTAGRVTASTVAEVKEYRRKRLWTLYEAQVSYQYTVEGQSYQAGRVAWDPPRFPDLAKAQQFAANYPAGSQVTVSYNPRRPDSAVLQPHSEPQVSNLNSQGIGCLIGAALLIGIFSWPWLAARAITVSANRQTADEAPLVQRPARDMLVGIQPFPPDWVINECDGCEMFNNDEQAIRQFRITDMSRGVVQSVFRFESPAVAQTRFATAMRNMAKEMSLDPAGSYHSPIAGAQTSGCGIDFGQLVCLQLHRYGQYLVFLEYYPGYSEPGLEAAEVDAVLRAIDALARERLGAGSITSAGEAHKN